MQGIGKPTDVNLIIKEQNSYLIPELENSCYQLSVLILDYFHSQNENGIDEERIRRTPRDHQ